MKNKSLYISSLSMLLLMAACADEQIAEFKVEKPAIIEQYEYLNSYDVLKTYVNRAANPGFKLGIALSANDFTAGDQVHSLAVSNFDEMTAGNEMKYASCVADDGTMNFYNVTKFVNEAKNAGMTIYGHTLGWHSQQNNKYLNSLIADKEIEVDPEDKVEKVDYEIDYSTSEYKFWNEIDNATIAVNKEKGCLDIINPDKKELNYLVQYHVADGISIKKDNSYTLKMLVRATDNGTLNLAVGNWGATSDGSAEFTTEWKELTMDFQAKGDGGFVMVQSGLFVGTIQIKNVKIVHTESPAVEMEQEVRTQTYQDGPFPFYQMGCAPDVINGAIHFVPQNPPVWSQFFIMPGGDNALDEGNYILYLDLTSSKDASGVELTMQNGWEDDAQKINVSVPVQQGQHHVKLNISGIKGGNYDVILKPQSTDATLDVKSLKICKLVKMNTIPLTPEEKKDTLTWAMDNWIRGMMEATGGYVTSWDLANETVSGGGDDNGIYELQSAENSDNPSANFYWQDYLGDIDYVRILESKARKYFAEYGGNPSDLKLFINDFNLESWWDGNKKAKSLVEWIKRWEADGVTKIDGIGTQMHVSYILNEADQKAQEDAIVNMFNILAESGKLVKISELDMGIVDKAFGTGIKTENVTLEQQQKMAEFYTFIIRKYFEIIPAEQQYGITQWCATDSPADSGWRGGEPVGLWDINYNRKPAYGGFADGLKGGE
ncbi:endo-1,4-beta-xylanase [Bacteroides caecigallinarum]|nr:endo-1,4-beta-xylanase [Bacteroides caecigallinarum]